MATLLLSHVQGNHWLQSSKAAREAETKSQADSVNRMFELGDNERGTYTVRDLRNRYERIINLAAASVSAASNTGTSPSNMTPVKGSKDAAEASKQQMKQELSDVIPTDKVSDMKQQLSGKAAASASADPSTPPPPPEEDAAVVHEETNEDVLFEHDELVALRLLFSLFDR